MKIFFLIALGLLSFIISQCIEENIFWKGVFSNIGSAILVAGILTVMSEYVLKNELIEFLLEKVKLKTQIDSMGLEEIHSSASKIDYTKILSNSISSIDVVHTNGAEWIGRHMDIVREVLETKNCTIRVFLMSPSSVFLDAFAQHIKQPQEYIINRIQESVELWKSAVDVNVLKGKLKIYYHNVNPTSSLVRVDNRIINIQNKLISVRSKKLLCTIFRSTGREDDMFSVLSNEIKVIEERSELVFESQ